MGCCGQKRERLTKTLWTQGDSIPIRPRTSRPLSSSRSLRLSASMSGREVVIKYLGNVHIRVQGRATSRIYEFSVQRPINPVDARDAHALLKTRFFSRCLPEKPRSL